MHTYKTKINFKKSIFFLSIKTNQNSRKTTNPVALCLISGTHGEIIWPPKSLHKPHLTQTDLLSGDLMILASLIRWDLHVYLQLHFYNSMQWPVWPQWFFKFQHSILIPIKLAPQGCCSSAFFCQLRIELYNIWPFRTHLVFVWSRAPLGWHSHFKLSPLKSTWICTT